MARIMSEETKYELAEELGFAHKVKDGDWGNITTREAGSLVREAIRRAEADMAARRNQIIIGQSYDHNNQKMEGINSFHNGKEQRISPPY